MSRHPLAISPDDSVRKARMLMRDGHVRRLPVLDGERLVGIITAGDIWRRSPSLVAPLDEDNEDELLDHIQVGGIMTLQPRVTSPETPIIDAARAMLQYQIHALPVVDRGQLVGILTESDVLRAMVAELAGNHDEEYRPRPQFH
ncbi:MAG: CBS domain-containing protein [Deltaproteobacteria bacterium]|nr:CBS domain-containing protein [Deltaproteobacteria bacterium]